LLAAGKYGSDAAGWLVPGKPRCSNGAVADIAKNGGPMVIASVPAATAPGCRRPAVSAMLDRAAETPRQYPARPAAPPPNRRKPMRVKAEQQRRLEEDHAGVTLGERRDAAGIFETIG
jgi:hypothetical protein